MRGSASGFMSVLGLSAAKRYRVSLFRPSAALELGRPSLNERRHTRGEIAGRRLRLLDLRLELELLLDSRIDAGVELALGPGVGPGRSRGEAVDQRANLRR